MSKAATKQTDGASGKPPSFETALGRLENIVELLDDGNIPLAEALKLFKEGTKLAALCRTLLAQAEQQVKEALRESDAASGAPTQPPGEVLLVPRRGVDDLEGPGERRAPDGVRGQERDPVVDLPRAEPAGQILDLAGELVLTQAAPQRPPGACVRREQLRATPARQRHSSGRTRSRTSSTDTTPTGLPSPSTSQGMRSVESSTRPGSYTQLTLPTIYAL